MFDALDPIDRRLLEEFQRDLPLVPSPYAAMAHRLGITQAETLARLAKLREAGAVARVGAVARPNTLGASTLAALAVAPAHIARAAAVLTAEPGVNHAYLREDAVNLWFVATAPDRAALDESLSRIGRALGQTPIDLPLERPYHIDLGFSLAGVSRKAPARPFDPSALRADDRGLAQALCDGLELVARPWQALARLGVIVRHRRLGWLANAMVCLRPPARRLDRVGALLAAAPGVTLCYRRRPDALRWNWPLFCMIHARTREVAERTLADALRAADAVHAERKILFSTRCLTQRAALLAAPATEIAA
jgi:DNA-binding Lrp family transcriptional regulator